MTDLAPVIPEINPHTGRPRLRCSVCHKVAYETEELAYEAAEKISLRVQMVVYQGHKKGKKCGWWHLSRKPVRRNQNGKR